jgi:serine/threonine protein kinase
MTPRVPAHIGRYPVSRLLARGGMGAVYLARHPVLGTSVALKTLDAGRSASDAQKRRFQREVDALAKLEHPHVVRVLEAGEEQGVPWFAMRLVEGPTLSERIREGPLPLEQVVTLGTQICSGLAAAHAAEILHRDLKPENVLCATGDRFVVTDFGLAKDLEVVESVRLSQTGMVQGTPRYWSPEQARGEGGRATRATDVYGLGATLYAALTGRPPIDGESWAEVLVATQSRQIPDPRALRPEVPEWLSRVVMRCLEREPTDRYPSMSEVREALERGPPPAEDEEVPRRSLAIPLALVASALTIGVVVWIYVVAPRAARSAREAEALIRVRALPATTWDELMARRGAQLELLEHLGDRAPRALRSRVVVDRSETARRMSERLWLVDALETAEREGDRVAAEDARRRLADPRLKPYER